MKTAQRRLGAAFALLAGLAGFAAESARAREPERPQPQVRKVYSRQMSFRLPVQLEDRAGVRELRFWVRDPDGHWDCKEVAPPTQTNFSFTAPEDGEYRFAIASVDRNGRSSPASPEQAPPAMVVVVDTRPPVAEVHPLPTTGPEVYLQCNLRDPNPDYASVRMSYRTPDGSWQPLEMLQPDLPGVFRIPDPSVLSGQVQVTAADRAGNQTEQLIDLGAVSARLTARGQAPAAPPPAPAPAAQPLPKLASVPPATVKGGPKDSQVTQARYAAPAEPETPAAPPADPIPATQEPAEPRTEAVEAPAQLLNGNLCKLDYSIEDVPPGTRVEFWCLRKGGRNWVRLTDKAEGRSPADLTLPGEGVFSLLVRPAGPPTPPASGELPTVVVEVDTTRPFVEMHPPVVGTGDEAGTVTVVWTVQDKNLAADPITLSYAARPQGPWVPFARKIANDGVFRWVLPPDLGGKVYLRLEACDRAGNVGRCDSRDPVVLEPARPKVGVPGGNAGGEPGE